MNKDKIFMPLEHHKIILPRPVNGPVYDGWTLERWLLKVCEEVGEAVTAGKHFERTVKKYKEALSLAMGDAVPEPRNAYACCMEERVKQARANLCLELTDTITAAVSVLEYLGCDFNERQRFQQEINDNNACRDGGRRFKEE